MSFDGGETVAHHRLESENAALGARQESPSGRAVMCLASHGPFRQEATTMRDPDSNNIEAVAFTGTLAGDGSDQPLTSCG